MIGVASMRQEFEEAFEAWVTSEIDHIKRDTSREVYRAIWTSFVRDLPTHVAVQEITSEMVAGYLVAGASKLAVADEPQSTSMSNTRKDALSIRYQARVASLIEKIMNHHARATKSKIAGESAVQSLLRKTPALANALKRETREEPTLDVLSHEEHAALKVRLIEDGKADMAGNSTLKWSEVRDRTSMALQLGAGLSPSDVRELTMGERTSAGLNANWNSGSRFLLVPKNGKLFRRYTLVDPWAGILLDQWFHTLRDRDRASLSRITFVFPGETVQKEGSSKQPGQWSKPGQHKQVTKFMEAMKISGSSFKLRHSWAMEKLREGESEREVARWLGVQDGGEVIERYKEALAIETAVR
jgi:site-specific recombinase XerD